MPAHLGLRVSGLRPALGFVGLLGPGLEVVGSTWYFAGLGGSRGSEVCLELALHLDKPATLGKRLLESRESVCAQGGCWWL